MLAKLEGMEELHRKLQDLHVVLSRESYESSLKQGRELAKTVRGNIKQGPRGNLKRAVVVRSMSDTGPVIVGIDRRIAPHAHLVEFGGENVRYPTRKKALATPFGPRAHVQKMPAQGFFRNAWDGSRDKILRNMEADCKKAIR